MGKAFEKQIKTIEDQEQKQTDALENLKPNLINLLKKERKMMNELYNSVDYNNLKFDYVGPTNGVSNYEYMDSKDLCNAIKNFQIKFSEAKNK